MRQAPPVSVTLPSEDFIVELRHPFGTLLPCLCFRIGPPASPKRCLASGFRASQRIPSAIPFTVSRGVVTGILIAAFAGTRVQLLDDLESEPANRVP